MAPTIRPAAPYDTVTQRARAAGLTHFTVTSARQSRQFLSRCGWQFDRMETFLEDGNDCTMAMMFLDLTP